MNEGGHADLFRHWCGAAYILGTEEEKLMATVLRHRKVNIVVLEQDEPIAGHCRDGDIAIVVDGEGWWIKFVGADGHIDCYGDPYPSYNEALWSAKAAAEFGT